MPSDTRPDHGFEPFRSSPFSDAIGSLHLRRTDGAPVFGVEVPAQFANTSGGAHGGYLAGLIDLATGQATRMILGADRPLRTISMSVDYVAPARIGAWVEAEVAVDHSGQRMVFSTCRVTSAGQLVAKAQVVLSS